MPSREQVTAGAGSVDPEPWLCGFSPPSRPGTQIRQLRTLGFGARLSRCSDERERHAADGQQAREELDAACSGFSSRLMSRLM